jgi:hypothetical protein
LLLGKSRSAFALSLDKSYQAHPKWNVTKISKYLFLSVTRYLQVCLLQGLELEQKTVPSEVGKSSYKAAADKLIQVFESGAAGRKFEARIVECLTDLIEHLTLIKY